MMPLTVQFNELVPPSTTDLGWQRTADAVFKGLVLNGCITVQLRVGGRHQAALQAAYDLLGRQPFAPGQAGCVEWKELGHKQVLTVKSGPWQGGALNSQQHRVLQALTADHDICASVLTCIAASRGVRLPRCALHALLGPPQLDQQRWSPSLLQAFRYSPAAAGAAAGTTAIAAAATAGLPAEGLCPAHVDRGCLTLVYAPGQAGLQVRDAYGEWQAMGPLGQDQVLLMPGHALEYALCGLLPAAQHRVVASEAGQLPRYSLTFKLLPAPAAQLDFSAALDAAGHAVISRRYPPIAGAALMEQLSRTHESVNASRDELASAAAAHDSFPTLQQAVATAAATGAAVDMVVQQAAETVALAASSEGAGSPVSRGGSIDEEVNQPAAQAARLEPTGVYSRAAKRPAAHSSHRGKDRSKVARWTAAPQAAEAGVAIGPGFSRGQQSVLAAIAGVSMPAAAAFERQQAARSYGMMELVFKGIGADDCIVHLRRTTKLHYIFEAYCTQVHVCAHEQRFAAKGMQLDRDYTAAHYRLRSGDVVEVAPVLPITGFEAASKASGAGAVGAAGVHGWRQPGPSAKAAAAKGQVAGSTDDTLHLVLKSLSGRVFLLQCGRFATFGSIIRSYAAEVGLPARRLSFIYYGRQVEWEYTPAAYEVEDGDRLFCIFHFRID